MRPKAAKSNPFEERIGENSDKIEIEEFADMQNDDGNSNMSITSSDQKFLESDFELKGSSNQVRSE